MRKLYFSGYLNESAIGQPTKVAKLPWNSKKACLKWGALDQITPAEAFSQWPVRLPLCLLKAAPTWRWSTETFCCLSEVILEREKTPSEWEEEERRGESGPDSWRSESIFCWQVPPSLGQRQGLRWNRGEEKEWISGIGAMTKAVKEDIKAVACGCGLRLYLSLWNKVCVLLKKQCEKTGTNWNNNNSAWSYHSKLLGFSLCTDSYHASLSQCIFYLVVLVVVEGGGGGGGCCSTEV